MQRIAILCALLLVVAVPARAETITLVADSWCPYNCDPKSDKPGFLIEIAQRAFSRNRISVQYTTVPWTQAIEETRQNKHNAIVGASTSDAPDFVFPGTPQGSMQNNFYIAPGNSWHYSGRSSLSGIVLGVISDYSYGKSLDDYIKRYRGDTKRLSVAEGDDALDINVKKLLAGSIQVLIEDEHVMQYYQSKHPEVVRLESAGVIIDSQSGDLYIAFSPQNPDSKRYAQILEQETINMRKNGEIRDIMSKYGLK